VASATKITAQTISRARAARDRGAKPGQRYHVVIRDAVVAGLSLEVGASGMTWRFSYKPRGITEDGKRRASRSISFGDVHTLHPDEARHLAAEAKDRVRQGGDPAEDRKVAVAREIEERRTGRTCGEMLDGFAEWAANRDGPRGGKVGAKYVHDLNREARAALVALGALDLPPAAVSPRQIGSKLGKGKRGSAAMLRMNALRLFFDFVIGEGAADANPCNGLTRDERPKAGSARQRVLDPDEVAAVWSAAADLLPLPRDLIRFMLCVPARGIEVTRMRWRDIRGDHWQQSGTETKNGEDHRYFLNAISLEVLEARAEAQGGRDPEALVFPGRTGKPAARNSIKASLTTRLGDDFPEWTLHDLRRTFASLLARNGCRLPESAIDGALNHKASATRGGVVGIYMAEPRKGEQDEALREWGALLADIIGRPAPDNVVKIGARA
jgi:integrase